MEMILEKVSAGSVEEAVAIIGHSKAGQQSIVEEIEAGGRHKAQVMPLVLL